MDSIVQTKNLFKKFQQITAVNDLTLSIPKGKITTLLGANGSGKTTFMRILACLVKPTSGSIIFDGEQMTHKNKEIIQRSIGYMSQRFYLYDELTVLENLSFIANIRRVPDSRKRIEELIEKFELSKYLNVLALNLSGGWRQKLSLAGSIISYPKLLILDEPTAGVDVLARQMFWNELALLNQSGISIIMSTHYMDEIDRSDYVCYFTSGKLLSKGEPKELVRQLSIKSWHVLVPSPNRFLGELRRKFPQLSFDWINDIIHVRSQNISPRDEKQLVEFIAKAGGSIVEAISSIHDAFIILGRKNENYTGEN